MDTYPNDGVTFSSKKRVFRVLSVDEDVGTGRLMSRSPIQDRTALWLSPALEDAVDRWVAAQADPKPSRLEAIRRLLEKGLAG